MSTIELTCSNCGNQFAKDKNEYKRRLAKLPDSTDFYCNLSCSTSHHNRLRDNNVPPPIQYGNKYRKKYPPEVSWYVRRCSADHRFALIEQSERIGLATGMMEKWNDQQGKCAYSGVALTRKNIYGKCIETNPFKIASIDRIDCSKHYTVDNIQWVSLAMNLARKDTDDAKFRDYLTEFMNRS